MHKIILSTLLLTSFTFAEKSYSFLGAETSYLNYNSISTPSLGLKYGIQKGMWRSSINLDHASKSSDTLTSLILQVDKGILKNITKNSPFKPHIGFSVGLIQHEATQKEKGFAFGLNTGISYLLNDDIDLDLSYRYMDTGAIKSITSLHSLSLSLHYFY